MDSPKTSLKSGVVGLIGAATLGTVMLSPAMTLYGNFGPSFVSAGKAAPLAFIWALIATLPTAASYALLASEYPDSGSAASWSARAISPRVGQWAGWMVFLYYLTNFVMQPVTLGLFLSDLLGAHSNLTVYVLGALICCLWPAWIVYRGISLSTKGALSFLLFEATVVAALCLTVAFSGVPLTFEGFHVTASPQGVSGLFQAMVFGMLAFCGFDVVSTLAEETEMPRKRIPQATFLSLFIYGAFVIAGVWALSFADSPERLKAIADQGGMPISEIARVFWGRGAVLVNLTGISAALGIAIATSVGASRILFSMAREGRAPSSLAKLHPKYQVPWSAMHCIFVGGLTGAIAVAALVGSYSAYVWWGTTSTFFAMLTYLLVNLSNISLNRHKLFDTPFHLLAHGLIPLVGIGADGYILVRSFFIELWHQGWATGRSVILFDSLCAVIALAIVLRSSSVRPEKVLLSDPSSLT